MKEEKQKTLSGCHAEAGTEFRAAYGVQTCMGIIENNLVEVPIVKGDLLTHIVSPSNMNLAYKRVVSNAGMMLFVAHWRTFLYWSLSTSRMEMSRGG